MEAFVLDPTNTRDIATDVLDKQGRLRVLPASYWATTTPQERGLLGFRHALYSFPTQELVDHLSDLIAGRHAIEIGAGHGVLSTALGIVATDTREQERIEYRRLYALQGQPTVTYGRNVIAAEASQAVRKFKPQVVVACWVTQNWDPKRPEQTDAKPNGVDEEDIIHNCEEYILVGNEHVHQNKRIWSLPHTITYPEFVYSRAQNGTREFIAVFRGNKARDV